MINIFLLMLIKICLFACLIYIYIIYYGYVFNFFIKLYSHNYQNNFFIKIKDLSFFDKRLLFL